MKFLALSVVAVVASLVGAQTPDACITDCASQACPDFPNDITCFCSTGMQEIANCLLANCTAADLQTATALGDQFCGNSTSTGGGNSTATGSSGSPTATGSETATAQSSGASETTGTHTSSGSTGSPSASKSASSSTNIGGGSIAGVLALAVAIAVTVGVVA